MKHIFRLLACASIFFNSQFSILNSQELPQGYFRSPLDGPIALSATFAELRMNHFHGGIDMRTGGEIGKPVYAVADGYVSRISVSPWGGGKILYIAHANGYTSVYMHLNDYAGDIGKAVLKEQYERRNYSVVRTFAPGELPVKQGQVVAHSGNTGGSAGPHLHFELRETATGRTVNPLLFGLPYTDNIRPVIRGIRVYPLGGRPVDVGTAHSVSVGGPFYIGIYSTDAAEGSTPKNGPDRVEVYADGSLLFMYTTDAFCIDSGRVSNAIMDFTHFSSSRQPYIVTRSLPGAEGEWVPVRQTGGIVSFGADTLRRITIKVFDIKGNSAEQSFSVHLDPTLASTSSRLETKTDMCYRKPWQYSSTAFSAEMPTHTLYADDRMYTAVENYTQYISPVCTVEPSINRLPPQRAFTISINKTPNINVTPDKVTVVHISPANKLTAYKTTYADGRYTASVREFGRFVLMADTEDPQVRAINFSEGKPLKVRQLKVKITDNLSGVETFNCYLNGQWILGEFDGKSATVSIDTGNKLKAGKNELQVDVTDGCGNLARHHWTLTK